MQRFKQRILEGRDQLEAAAQIALDELSGTETSPVKQSADAKLPMVGWTVMVNAFHNKASAQALRLELEQTGLDAFSQVNQQGEQALHEVHVGPYIKLEAARAIRDELSAQYSSKVSIRAFIP